MANIKNFTGGPTAAGSASGSLVTTSLQAAATSPLDGLTIDYNKEFANATPLMYRDAIVREMESILIGSMKPNVLLVGDAGTGKTALVEELARRIATHDPTLPRRLAKSTVLELPFSALVAGAGIVGDLEQRIRDVIEYAEDPANDAIVFIDEIHVLLDKHDSVTGRISQLLKPALARGKMRVIGATTTQESRSLMDDPAFSRRFTRLVVNELTEDQTVEVLESQLPRLCAHYDGKVVVPDALLPNVVATADETMVTHRPDNALTLLDRVCSEVRMQRAEKEASQDPVMQQYVRAIPSDSATEDIVRSVAERLAKGVADDFSFDRDRISSALSEVQGQSVQVAEIVDALARRSRHLFPETRPLSFLLAGPSGVGKSMCARIIARELVGTDAITINMTEYSSETSLTRLLGAPPSYVGYSSMQEKPLDPLMTNPYRVVVLDEFEKASPNVQRVFMEALDTGHIKDNQGRTIDMSKAIIFATTNAGCDRAAHNAIGFGADDTVVGAGLVDVLAEWFDVALINRFGHLVRFNGISRDVYGSIVQEIYAREAARVMREHSSVHLPDTLSDDELERIVHDTYVAKLGARPAARAVRGYIEAHA